MIYLGLSPSEYWQLTLMERETLQEVYKQKQAKEAQAYRR